MKIKSKKFKSKKLSSQGKMYPGNHYQINVNDFSRMNVNSTDFYPVQSYRKTSRYKYTHSSYKKPLNTNGSRTFCRPNSPVLGSEEYMTKKIEQTSAIIMRQLLNPEEKSMEPTVQKSNENGESSTNSDSGTKIGESSVNINCNKNKIKKNNIYNIDEIQKKIMNHITNLNNGKKKNLINSNMSGYDSVIEQIQKQKRLEISRALRAMCSQSKETQESSDFINSIIPDMGIKIEDLPRDLIEELTNTLSLEPEWSNDDLCYIDTEPRQLYTENPLDDILFEKSPPVIYVKPEPTDDFIIGKQNEKNRELSDEIVFNDLNYYENIDSIIGNPNNKQEEIAYKHNKFDFVHSIINSDKSVHQNQNSADVTVSLQKEVYEKSGPDRCNYTNEMRNNQENTIDIKKEICQHSENDYCNCICEKNSDTQNNVENIIDGEELTVNSSFIPTKICDINKEIQNKSNIDNTTELVLSPNIASENNCRSTSNMLTQTDEEYETDSAEKFIDCFLAKYYTQAPKNLSDTISRMFEIDQCVLKLTNYRQSLFAGLSSVDKFDGTRTTLDSIRTEKNYAVLAKKRKKTSKRYRNKKKKCSNLNPVNEFQDSACVVKDPRNKESNINNFDRNESEQRLVEYNEKDTHPKHLEFLDIHEKMLVIKIAENKLVAGTESGKIIFCSLENGNYSKILNDFHVPITSLLFIKHDMNTTHMYVGSFEKALRIYNFHNYSIIKNIALEDSIQCMEWNWGYVFIGGIHGSLLRYSIKKRIVEYEDKFSDTSILVLKATQEGARRVLLVGSRNSPVCIRDAMTGLYMRTMENLIFPTVYSLITNKHLVYCGTTNHDILVYTFHDGKLVHRYKATNSKGIGCMKIDRNLLFASCHNGKIYVYNILKKLYIDSIDGPGGVILSMEIFKNQVIIGTMSFKFISLPIPQHILQHKI